MIKATFGISLVWGHLCCINASSFDNFHSREAQTVIKSAIVYSVKSNVFPPKCASSELYWHHHIQNLKDNSLNDVSIMHSNLLDTVG
jgi:hypothetical protein